MAWPAAGIHLSVHLKVLTFDVLSLSPQLSLSLYSSLSLSLSFCLSQPYSEYLWFYIMCMLYTIHIPLISAFPLPTLPLTLFSVLCLIYKLILSFPLSPFLLHISLFLSLYPSRMLQLNSVRVITNLMFFH